MIFYFFHFLFFFFFFLFINVIMHASYCYFSPLFTWHRCVNEFRGCVECTPLVVIATRSDRQRDITSSLLCISSNDPIFYCNTFIFITFYLIFLVSFWMHQFFILSLSIYIANLKNINYIFNKFLFLYEILIFQHIKCI